MLNSRNTINISNESLKAGNKILERKEDSKIIIPKIHLKYKEGKKKEETLEINKTEKKKAQEEHSNSRIPCLYKLKDFNSRFVKIDKPLLSSRKRK